MTELIFSVAIALLFLGLIFVQSYSNRRKWHRYEARRRRDYERRRERTPESAVIEGRIA